MVVRLWLLFDNKKPGSLRASDHPLIFPRTVGSQTISVRVGEFVIIRKVLQTGASTDARFIVVARGAV